MPKINYNTSISNIKLGAALTTKIFPNYITSILKNYNVKNK